MHQDGYELPSIYSQKPGFAQLSQADDGESTDVLTERVLEPLIYNPASDRTLAWLLLLTPLSMLIFTVVPVVATLPDPNPMLTGDAIWRIVDPVITLPLNLLLLLQADKSLLNTNAYNGTSIHKRTVIWILWSIGAAIYVQGHGIHLAAALFKHPVQDFMLEHPELMAQPAIADELQAIYSNMRDLWEHIVAHYMYAFGAMWMSWVQIYAFHDQTNGPLTLDTKIVFAFASLIYGALIAGVAIEFPEGLYVGLPYTIVLGLVCVAVMLFRQLGLPKGGLLSMGRRMVVQSYIGASIVALIIVIGWLGKYGFDNRLAAGVA